MTIVQSASGTSTGASFTVTLPSPASASNVVVIFVAGNTTVTTLSGWTLRTSQVNEMGHYLYEKAGAGDNSWTWSNTSGQLTWVAIEIQGGAYISASGQNNTAAANSYNTPNNTPTAGTRIILASIGSLTTGSSVRTVSSWTNSFTELADLCQASADYPMQGVAYLDNVAANGSTAYSTTATFSSSNCPSRSALIASYATSAGGSDVTEALDPGALIIAGLPATSVSNRQHDLDPGPLTFAGLTVNSSTLTNLSSDLEPGPLSFAGLPATSLTGKVSRTYPGAIGLDGLAPTLDIGTITVQGDGPASITAAGMGVRSLTGMVHQTDPGGITADGLPAVSATGMLHQSDPGGLIFAGLTVTSSTLTNLTHDLDPGGITFAGLPAVSVVGNIHGTDPGDLTLSGLPATSAAGMLHNTEPGALQFAGLPVTVSLLNNSTSDLDPGSVTAAGLPATSVSSTIGQIEPGALTLSGMPVVALTGTVDATFPGGLSFAGLPATSVQGAAPAITVGIGPVVFSGMPAVATGGITTAPRDITITAVLGSPSWSATIGVPVQISTLSLEFVAARITSRAANGSPAVVLDTQPVYLGLTPAGTAPQLNQFFPASWVGAAGTVRWCRMLVGPGGGVATYTPGEYDVYARVEDVTELAVRGVVGKVTFA